MGRRKSAGRVSSCRAWAGEAGKHAEHARHAGAFLTRRPRWQGAEGASWRSLVLEDPSVWPSVVSGANHPGAQTLLAYIPLVFPAIHPPSRGPVTVQVPCSEKCPEDLRLHQTLLSRWCFKWASRVRVPVWWPCRYYRTFYRPSLQPEGKADNGQFGILRNVYQAPPSTTCHRRSLGAMVQWQRG